MTITKPKLRKMTQTITLTIEFWGTGETLDEAPEKWDWTSAAHTGGDLYSVRVDASGPIEGVDRHDYVLDYRGLDGRADGWNVYDTEGDSKHQPVFIGSHADAKRWIEERGGHIRRWWEVRP